MRITGAVLASLRVVIRALRTDDPSPSRMKRAMLAALLVPPFGLLVVLLRVYAVLRGPVAVTAVRPDGLRFHCELPDLIQMYIWLFDLWEPDLTAFVARRLEPGTTFVDVGANVGYFSAVAATAGAGAGDRVRVVAIEASPRIFPKLRRTITENELEDAVRCVNIAAMAERGLVCLFSGPTHNIGLTTTVPSRGLAAETEVPAAPLSDLLTQEEMLSARLVKIDVEGGEDAVLAGMSSFVEVAPRQVELLVELSPCWWSDSSRTPLDVLKPLFEAGFHAYEIHNSYWPWHYLWPKHVRRPRRLRRHLNGRVRRIDLVLSRVDAEEL